MKIGMFLAGVFFLFCHGSLVPEALSLIDSAAAQAVCLNNSNGKIVSRKRCKAPKFSPLNQAVIQGLVGPRLTSPLSFTGSTFRPRKSTVIYTSSPGSCIYAEDEASQIFNVPLSLPNGVQVDFIRVHFYDTSDQNGSAWFTVYDFAGSVVSERNVNSSGNSGYGTVESAAIDHVVDHSSHSYVLNWRPNVVGVGMRLCGMEVHFSVPEAS